MQTTGINTRDQPVSKYARRGRKRNGSQIQRQVTADTYNRSAKVEVGQMANGDTPHRFLRLNALFKRSYDAKPAETGGESLSLPSHQAHALSCLSKGTTVQRIRGRHARHASVLSYPVLCRFPFRIRSAGTLSRRARLPMSGLFNAFCLSSRKFNSETFHLVAIMSNYAAGQDPILGESTQVVSLSASWSGLACMISH